MRTKMRRNSKLFAALSMFLCASAMLTIFQNCGSFDLSSTNPLYDSNISSTCLGINCTRDLNTVKIRAGFSSYTVENAPGGVSATPCSTSLDSSQCLDVGGFCEAGGYPDSIFYYQWILAASTGVETAATGVKCDDNGRFHLQVHVPTGYDWTKINHLRIIMKVIDENGGVSPSPTGSGEFIYQVSTRAGS